MPEQVEEKDVSPTITFKRTLREKSGLTQKAVDSVLAALGESLIEATELGKVQVRGVGVFEKKTTPARVGRNPSNGQPVNIPEKSKIVLKTSMKL